MRILCYSPYSGIWSLHGIWEFIILWGLKLRGIQVKIIICDGIYSDCDIHWESTNPRKTDSCTKCIRSSKKLLKYMHFEDEYDYLGKYLSESDFLLAQNCSSLLKDEFEKFSFNDFKIGEYIKSSVHSHFRINHIDYSDKKIIETFRSYIYSGILAYISLNKILNIYKPDRVLLFNGRMSSLRILLELCKLKNIPAYIHERGKLNNSLTIKWNTHCLDNEDLISTWRSWENIPLKLNELEKVKNLLNDRSKGKNFSWKSFSYPECKENNIFNIIKENPNKKIVILFTSSGDEISIINTFTNIFNSQLEWIESSIQFFQKQKDCILIIKAHPNICSLNSKGINFQEYQDLLCLKDKLIQSQNIFLIMPDEKINSYKLMDLSHIIITYGSTVGLEGGALGKPVVICRKDLYHGVKGFISINDKNEYNNILNKLLQLDYNNLDYNNKEIKKYSYRFLYHYFFRMCVPFPLVSVINVYHWDLNFKNINDLNYGNDIYLDKITTAIIENKPLYSFPDEEDYKKDEEDENKFFSSKVNYLNYETLVSNNNPLVSVIITCENVKYLRNSIESVLNQSFRDFEIIVVNNNLITDSHTIEYLISNYSNYKIRLINYSSEIPFLNRNIGIENSKGKYILSIDSYDILTYNMLEECIKTIDKYPSVSFVYMDRRLDYDELCNNIESNSKTLSYICYCILFKRIVWDKIGGYSIDIKGAEDLDFWFSCFFNGFYGKKIPIPPFLVSKYKTDIYKNVLKNYEKIKFKILSKNKF